MASKIATCKYLDGSNEETTSIVRAGKVDIVYENDDKFVGEVDENGKKTGNGTYSWASGATYTGEYKNGKREGQGEYKFKNGSVYKGQFVGGKKEGEGTETYINGDKFVGTFVDGFKKKGVYFYSSGAKLSGSWELDELVEGEWTFGEKRLSTKSIFEKLGKRFSMKRKSVKKEKKALGLVIAGAPASGKGTAAERIKEEYGVIHCSTGDMLRAAVAAGSELGLKAKELMEAGALVPDELVIGAVRERLQQPDVMEHGFLLDGFPRTKSQAQALLDQGIKVDLFVLLDVPDEILVERVTGRRIDPETGNSYHVKFNPPPKEIEDRVIVRADDTEEKVKVRLEGYYKNIEAIKDFYSENCVIVDGARDKTKVFDDIQGAISQL